MSKKIIFSIMLLVLSSLVFAQEWAPAPPSGDEELPPPAPANTYDSTLDIIEVKVDVDGKSDKITSNNKKIDEEAKEESTVKFDIKIKNLFEKELEDIDVEVTIEDIDDGDDLDEKASISKLDSGDSKEVDVDFELPLKVDDGDYDVKIHVEGEDEDNNMHVFDWVLELEVKKEKNDVVIKKASILPSTVSCGQIAELFIQVLNLGRVDEDIEIEISNEELGVTVKETDIELDTGTGDDAEYEKKYRLRIADNMEEGIYPLNIKVSYNNGRFSRTEDVDLIIQDCKEVKETKKVETVKVVKTSSAKTTGKIQKPPAQISYSMDDGIIIFVLVVLIVILGGFGIFLLTFLFKLKKK
jgi:uncharacterized membrane protein